MSMISIYRYVLVLSWLVALFELGCSFMLEDTLPTGLKYYLMGVHKQEVSTVVGFSSLGNLIITFVIMPVVIVALWRFQHWGRVLYVISLVILTIMSLMLGPYVSTGLESMFNMIGNILNGMLLVMMFSGDIRYKFSCKVYMAS